MQMNNGTDVAAVGPAGSIGTNGCRLGRYAGASTAVDYAQGGAGRPGKVGRHWPVGRRLVMHMLQLLFFYALARPLPPYAAARAPELHNLQTQVGRQSSPPAATALFDIVQYTFAGHVFMNFAPTSQKQAEFALNAAADFGRWTCDRLLRRRIGPVDRDSPAI